MSHSHYLGWASCPKHETTQTVQQLAYRANCKFAVCRLVGRLQHQIRPFSGLPRCLSARFECESANRPSRGVNHYPDHFAAHAYGFSGFVRRPPAYWNMKSKLDQIAFRRAVRTGDQNTAFTHVPCPAFSAAERSLCVAPVILDRRPQWVAHVSSSVRDLTPIDFVQICLCLCSTFALGRWKSHLSQRINVAMKTGKKPNVCAIERICFSGHSSNPGPYK